jgi:hypothetical protein
MQIRQRPFRELEGQVMMREYLSVQFVRRLDGRLLKPNSKMAEFKLSNQCLVYGVRQASFAHTLHRNAIQAEDPFQPKGPVSFGRKAEESGIVRDRRGPDRRRPKVTELAVRSRVR